MDLDSILLSEISHIEKHKYSYVGGPQPFWHQGPVSWKTIFLQLG